MANPPRKPASKFPHLRKQQQKNQIAQGKIRLKTERRKSIPKQNGRG